MLSGAETRVSQMNGKPPEVAFRRGGLNPVDPMIVHAKKNDEIQAGDV